MQGNAQKHKMCCCSHETLLHESCAGCLDTTAQSQTTREDETRGNRSGLNIAQESSLQVRRWTRCVSVHRILRGKMARSVHRHSRLHVNGFHALQHCWDFHDVLCCLTWNQILGEALNFPQQHRQKQHRGSQKYCPRLLTRLKQNSWAQKT